MKEFEELHNKFGDRFTDVDYTRIFNYIKGLVENDNFNEYSCVNTLSKSFILDIDTAKYLVDFYVKNVKER